MQLEFVSRWSETRPGLQWGERNDSASFHRYRRNSQADHKRMGRIGQHRMVRGWKPTLRCLAACIRYCPAEGHPRWQDFAPPPFQQSPDTRCGPVTGRSVFGHSRSQHHSQCVADRRFQIMPPTFVREVNRITPNFPARTKPYRDCL
jgi:hypothetical protein